MKQYARDNDITLDIINGVEDHVHCLIRLKTTQSVANVVGLLKGESSFWINRNVILDEQFEWQNGYGVISVSPYLVDGIRKYIYDQEAHHKEKSLKRELKEFEFNMKINKKKSLGFR